MTINAAARLGPKNTTQLNITNHTNNHYMLVPLEIQYIALKFSRFLIWQIGGFGLIRKLCKEMYSNRGRGIYHQY